MLVPTGQCTCDQVGCAAVRREVNNWLVVLTTEQGVNVLHWAACDKKMLAVGKHFCGVGHALVYASGVLQPGIPHPETAPKLCPPLNRDGSPNA